MVRVRFQILYVGSGEPSFLPMRSIIEKILWKSGLKGPIPSPPKREHPRGAYAELHDLPRYQPATVKLLDQDFKIADGFSFYWMYQEIFEDGVYDIRPDTLEPTIIDCGASYGVSALYFKARFPRCRIKAVEADPATFSLLSFNMRNHEHFGMELIHRAVAAESGLCIPFHCLGADAGRIHSGTQSAPSVLVKTICLDDLIDGPTDFLKIDIEGAETDVLRSSKKLDKVNQLFVEYHSFEDTNQSLGELLEILSDHGFRYYISTIFTPHRPFVEQQVNLGMDLQLGISATRLV
jgi:FkbM family methyltransferase